MTEVALITAYAVGVLNALVGLWGAWLWWYVKASRVYWPVVRAAQVACIVQAVLAGVVYVAARDRVDDDLYYLYAALPVFVGFVAEQFRILSAQSVLDARGFEDAQAVGLRPEAEQQSVVLAIVRRETGIMALACLVIAFLCWRATITL